MVVIVNEDIKHFLKYINNGEIKGKFTSKIDYKLQELKNREEIGVEYMTYELMLQDARDDAYNKGRAEGRNEGRTEGRFSNELKKLKVVMKKMSLTLDEAMEFLETPEEDKEKYIKALMNK